MFSILCALQFLTLCPPIVKRPFTDQELGRSVAYYPLVGLLIGLILFGANLGLAALLPSAVRGALVLTLWLLLSGTLHLDGFLDSMDGLFGGFSPEQRLEIMHDERIGAYGLSAGVILLLIKFSVLQSLPAYSPVLILIPTLSRWGISLAITGFPYAREQGLGRTIKDHSSRLERIIATLVAVAAAVLTASWTGIIASGLTVSIVWLSALLILRKIPGFTGDIYGAINELIELILLVVIAGGLSF